MGLDKKKRKRLEKAAGTLELTPNGLDVNAKPSGEWAEFFGIGEGTWKLDW